jgi:hypothetical protein
MSFKLVAPLVREFTLDKTDEFYENEGESTKVSIAQASQGENVRRVALFDEVTRVITERDENGDISIKQRWNMAELKRKEAFLTLVGCNIVDGDTGDPLFKFKTEKSRPRLAMSETQFNAAWDSLPPMVAEEIHEKVMLVNVSWAGIAGE